MARLSLCIIIDIAVVFPVNEKIMAQSFNKTIDIKAVSFYFA